MLHYLQVVLFLMIVAPLILGLSFDNYRKKKKKVDNLTFKFKLFYQWKKKNSNFFQLLFKKRKNELRLIAVEVCFQLPASHFFFFNGMNTPFAVTK